jgi:hypothetical protein
MSIRDVEAEPRIFWTGRNSNSGSGSVNRVLVDDVDERRQFLNNRW